MKMKRLSQKMQDVFDYFQRRNTKWTYFWKNIFKNNEGRYGKR